MNTEGQPDKQLQMLEVLLAELESLKPNAKVYEQKVKSSNVYFLARDRKAIIDKAKKQRTQSVKTKQDS